MGAARGQTGPASGQHARPARAVGRAAGPRASRTRSPSSQRVSSAARRVGAERDADGEQRRDRGDEMGEVPGAADGRRPPPDGPGGEHERRQRPDREPDPQPAEHPPGREHADAASAIASDSWSTARPEQRDERQQEERGEGREWQQHPAGVCPVLEQRIDVLEVLVARRRWPSPPRGKGGSRRGRGGTRPPATRSGCTGCSARGSRPRRRPRAERDQQPHDDGREAARDRLGLGGPTGALGYTPLHLQRCVRRLPRHRFGYGLARPGRPAPPVEVRAGRSRPSCWSA